MNIEEQITEMSKNGFSRADCAYKLGITIHQVNYLRKKLKLKFHGINKPQNTLDLTNYKIGQLTAIKPNGKSKNRSILWLCKCECGNEINVIANQLKSGYTTHCGCGVYEEKNTRWTGYKEITGSYFSTIKDNARKRNLEFKITIKYLWNLFLKQDRKCRFTDIELTFVKRWAKGQNTAQTASLDRIDSSKGYIEGNVQWVHKEINRMKLDRTDEEFINWCCLVKDKNVKKIS